VYAAVKAKGRDLLADSNGLPIWANTAPNCPPFSGEGGIQCLDCHPDPTNHKNPYQPGSLGATSGACLNCHPTPGMAAIHDAGLGGLVWTPDNTTCLAAGCHANGAIGLGP
jgi:hypothetical protein